MNRAVLRIILTVSVVIGLSMGRDALASELYKLSLAGIKLEKNERIAGIEITISAGRIKSLPSLPMGWNLVIDNDPSWTTSMRGNGLVGAAFLGSSDQALLKNLLTIERLSDELIAREVPFDVKAIIHIVNIESEQERTVSVAKDKLDLRQIRKKRHMP
ncbi:hypothetical protein [Geobacter sp.]|uniref:hypothetical protein n=1 Tax=Geobacter sp. TaxID=46610 RepID=UPI0026163871|nr:hypothetical protein [Geobacter sp.]